MKILLVFLACLTIGTVAVGQNLETIRGQKPVTLHGDLSLRTMFYQASGIPNRRQPFSYVLSGSPTLSIYGISVPLSFILSEQERSFRQPFNQFGMSPTYKWITLHAGYRNVSFSPFTLDGYTMLGGGFELHPGKWQVGFMYGRLNRAVVANQLNGDLQPISFSRKGLAGKIGYGNDTSFVALSFIKAKDDPNSIAFKSIDSIGVTPAENLAVSLGGRIGIGAYWYAEADAALSLYTANTVSSSKIDSTIANVPTSVLSLMTINASTDASRAYRAVVGYRHKTFGLSLQYRRIDPNYQSMGAYFFQNDLENYTLNPMFVLWSGKFRFNGSMGIQRDNLSGRKQATARRFIGSASASATFTERFGIDLAYSNFATTQTPVAIKFNDSLRVAQTTQNFSITPHYFIIGSQYSHVFTLSLNQMVLNDLSVFGAQRNINSSNAFLNYQFTIVPTGLNLFCGFTYVRLNTAALAAGNQGITFGGGKAFLNKKLSLRLTNSILQNTQGKARSMLFTHGLSGNYRNGKKHQFNLLVNYINNRGNAETQALGGYPQYNEWRGELGYSFGF
ncbi:MAG: hypothetical protein V4714_04960 [Bacteroidota bacterium]